MAAAALQEAALCAALGVVGGLAVAVGHGSLEELWFHVLRGLEARRLVRRLAPSIPATMTAYQRDSFLAVGLAHIPLMAGLAAFRQPTSCHALPQLAAQLDQHVGGPLLSCTLRLLVAAAIVRIAKCRHGLITRAKPELDLMAAWVFTWVVMVLHDAWFWAVHTTLHRFKVLYRTVHHWHHTTRGDLTVFGTAYGDWLDILCIFPPFYGLVMAWMYNQPSWNPVHFLFLGWAFNGPPPPLTFHLRPPPPPLDLIKLPAWVYVPGSLGVLLTPGAQRPKHHFIHHLDPRFNRSLYFTWWDRAAGTYRASHDRVYEGPWLPPDAAATPVKPPASMPDLISADLQ
eukprot:SM000344S13011  [mRNA]  locus=s344:58639:60047:+ [translate_table: standard]